MFQATRMHIAMVSSVAAVYTWNPVDSGGFYEGLYKKFHDACPPNSTKVICEGYKKPPSGVSNMTL